LEWFEVKPAKIKKGRSTEEILNAEAETIARRLAPRDYLVALDRTGRQYDSVELAAWINKLSTSPRSPINFIIGGPLGLSRQILDRAQEILSLSRLTLTHEMSRLILLDSFTGPSQSSVVRSTTSSLSGNSPFPQSGRVRKAI
jgi:23S rRNA (pseudouridine1915-N3)-methyltransferase